MGKFPLLKCHMSTNRPTISSLSNDLIVQGFENKECLPIGLSTLFCTKGKLFDQAGSLGPSSVYGADPYQGKVIVVHKGRYLVGATGFEDQNRAERLVTELQEKVQ